MAKRKTVIFCGCNRCSWGMHNSSWGRAVVKEKKQKLRHDTKHLLKVGKYDDAMDVIISVGYTD